jgi:MFS family permease
MISFMSRQAAKVISPYKDLPGSVYILFLAQIINRMGDFANFFLTLYLTRFLGFSEKQTGIVLSLVGISMMAGALLGGRLSDWMGRKKIMLTLQGLAALSVMICGFIPDKPLVALLLLIFTFFNGAVRPINSALLADLTNQKQRNSAFSLLYLGINIGVSAGPILAGFLFNHYRRWIFWGDALTTTITIILILLFIKEPVKGEMVLEVNENHDSSSSLKALLKRPVLAWYALATVFSSFIYSQHVFTLPLQILHLFKEDGPRFFGFIMSFNALAVLVLTPLLNYLCVHKKPLIRIAMGQLFYGLGFGLLIFQLPFGGWFFFTTLLWTTGEVLDAISGGVFIANHCPVNHRGRFNSLFLISKGGGRALAPLVSGFVLDSFGISQMWGLCLILGLVLFLLLRLLNQLDMRRNS